MRRKLILATPITITTACCAQAGQLSYRPLAQVYGFSSDDFGGGGSYLGVDTQDVTPERLSALKLNEERGVEVTVVDQDAPAGKAGLKEHDVIMTLNGQSVESVEQLRRMIHEIPPGRVVTIGITRNGQPLTLKAQLEDRKQAFGYANGKPFKVVVPAMPVMPAMPAMPDIDVPVSVVVVHSSLRSGLMVENLTPQLSEFFGTKNGQGVLVRSVDKGSRAEKAGFRAGDVIVRVNGETINDSGDFSHALRSRKNNAVPVGIIRDKREQTLTLSLPERKQSNLLNESIEIPDLDQETREEVRRAQAEIARLQPELEEYAKQMTAYGAEVRRLQPEIEKSTHEFLNKFTLRGRQL
jgi:predicted metalloprotease with PDZ domain